MKKITILPIVMCFWLLFAAGTCFAQQLTLVAQDTSTTVNGVPFAKPLTRPAGISDEEWSQLQMYAPKIKIAAPNRLAMLDPMTSPVPFVSLPLVPSSVPPGSGEFVLTVNGSQFVHGSTVNWNGTALATAFVSAMQLTAIVPASNVAGTGTALVTVSSPAPGGGVSDPVLFTIRNTSRSVTFAYSTIDVDVSPNGIAVADYNNDGIADLAVVNQNANPSCPGDPGIGTVSILLGKGDGTFFTKSKLCSPYPLGALFTATPGDFNGDGIQDLAVTLLVPSASPMFFEVFLGHGDGTFTRSGSNGMWDGAGPIVTGDFDRDGKLDLAMAGDLLQLPFIETWVGEGDGTFAGEWAGYTCANEQPIVVGDFNRDGMLDLANSSIEFSAWWCSTLYFGKGDGTFMPASSQPSASGLLTGDFDGDGILDLVGAGHFMKGNGDGTFTDMGPGPDLTSVYQAWRARGPAPGVAVDLNGDSLLDVVTVGPNNNVLLYLGNGDGTFQAPISLSVGQSPRSVVAGDFNGDGLVDLAVTNFGDNTVTILLQTPGYTASVQPPIKSDGSSTFQVSRGVVPIKFTLDQYGSPTCSLPPATISVTRTAGQSLGSVDEGVYSMQSDNGSTFRIDSCQYVYNLAASSLGAGTYRVDISINGIAVGHAVFALK